MNDENEHSYFRGEQRDERPKAICWYCDRSGQAFWVPKSLCEIRACGEVLEVEKWFADKEGMNDAA